MKKKGLIFILLVLVFLVMAISPVVAEDKLVPITKLGVAPWLGEVNENNLLEKFRGEKPNFINYIRYDLKKAVGLEISSVEAIKIVGSMESVIKEGVEKISFSDGTIFKSMGWKSRKTAKIMRTANPILKLGRKVEGFLIKVGFKDYEIKYVFLKDCGNLCLQDVKAELPPKAEYVPLPKEEAPLPKAEVLPLPPPPKTEAPSPPKVVEAPLPQKCPEQVVKVYVYVSSPAPAVVPGYFPPVPAFVNRAPIYYSQPAVSIWSSGAWTRPPSGAWTRPPSGAWTRPPHYPVRPPHVRTVPPAIKPPTVHTLPPATHSVGSPGVQTR